MGNDNEGKVFFSKEEAGVACKGLTYYSTPLPIKKSFVYQPWKKEAMDYPQVDLTGWMTSPITTLKPISFDEIANFNSSMEEKLPKKKTALGKWVPKRENGKLVPDGLVVRCNDSDAPVESPMAEKVASLQEIEHMFWLLTKDKVCSPLSPLDFVKQSYANIFESAKKEQISPYQLAIIVKPMTDSAAKSIAPSMAKKLETEMLMKYSDFFYANAPEGEKK